MIVDQRACARCHHPAADLGRPVAFGAALVARRPKPPSRAVQAVLVRGADRAVHLMRDLGDLTGGLPDADLAAARASAAEGRSTATAMAALSTATDAAAACLASNANCCWIAWNRAIGRSNWTRSLA